MQMRLSIIRRNERTLARGAAITLLGALAAGCSSNAMRFQDMVPTASTGSQQNYAYAQAPAAQAYPGDAGGTLDNTYTGSVSRAPRGGPVPPADVGQAAPVYQASAPSATAPLPAPNRGPVQTASLPPVQQGPALDPTPTGSTQRQPAPAPGPAEAGWNRTGGTTITARSGETVYNLSRRFGVPVDAILKANGMASASELTAGQKVVIPTYVYSGSAGVSAPDADPRVARAEPGRASAPAGDVPVPSDRGEQVAASPKQDRPQAPAAAAEGGLHTVASGDTLYALAKRYATTPEALKQANGLSDGYLRIGQKLKIPGRAGLVQTAAATPEKVDPVATGGVTRQEPAASSEAAGYTPPQKADRVIQASLDSAAPAPETTGISRMRWPVRGRVISAFGESVAGKPNDGIDISVPEGTPVKAAENGIVIYAGDGLKEFGNTVLVRHEDGMVTVYGHASKINVARGEKVRRGQEIALSGMSGKTEAPKLHFEVRKESTPVDPVTFLE